MFPEQQISIFELFLKNYLTLKLLFVNNIFINVSNETSHQKWTIHFWWFLSIRMLRNHQNLFSNEKITSLVTLLITWKKQSDYIILATCNALPQQHWSWRHLKECNITITISQKQTAQFKISLRSLAKMVTKVGCLIYLSTLIVFGNL